MLVDADANDSGNSLSIIHIIIIYNTQNVCLEYTECLPRIHRILTQNTQMLVDANDSREFIIYNTHNHYIEYTEGLPRIHRMFAHNTQNIDAHNTQNSSS